MARRYSPGAVGVGPKTAGSFGESPLTAGVFQSRPSAWYEQELGRVRATGEKGAAENFMRLGTDNVDPTSWQAGSAVLAAGNQAVRGAATPTVSSLGIEQGGIAQDALVQGFPYTPQQALQAAQSAGASLRTTQQPKAPKNGSAPLQSDPEQEAADRQARIALKINEAQDRQAWWDAAVARDGAAMTVSGQDPVLQGKRLRLDAWRANQSITNEHKKVLEKAPLALAGGKNAPTLTPDDYAILGDVFGSKAQPVVGPDGKQVAGPDGRPMFTNDTRVDPKSPLGKFADKFQREVKKDSMAAEAEMAKRVARENPQDRDAFFSIVDEVASAHPLTGDSLRRRAESGDLPENIQLSEKLAIEVKSKQTSPLTAKLGLKSDADTVGELSKYRTDLVSEKGYDPETADAIIEDIKAGDADEIERLETFRNTQTSAADAIADRKKREDEYGVLVGNVDFNNPAQVGLLVSSGGLSKENAASLNIDIPEARKDLKAYSMLKFLSSGVSTIDDTARQAKSKMASDSKLTPMDAASQAIEDAIKAGSIDGESINEDGRADIKRRVLIEMKRDAEQKAEEARGVVIDERRKMVEGFASTVKGLPVAGAGDSSWGAVYDESPDMVENGVVVGKDITQGAINYLKRTVMLDAQPEASKDYFAAGENAVLGQDPSGMNSEYLKPVANKIREIRANLEVYMAQKTEKDDIEKDLKRKKRVVEDSVVAANSERGLMTAIEYDEEGEPQHKTFSMNDPAEIKMYYDYIGAGDAEKAAILGRKAALDKSKTEANTIAREHINTMSQGLIMIRRAERTPGSLTAYTTTDTPWEPRSERDWDDYMQRMRGDLSVSPEAYEAWYTEAVNLKEKWRDEKVGELMKADAKLGPGIEKLSREQAEALMEEISTADSEWVTEASRGVRRAAKDIVGEESQVTPLEKSKLISDKRFIPKEQIPIETDIPDKYKFDTPDAAQAAESAGKIPDQTFVWVAGKPMLFTKGE